MMGNKKRKTNSKSTHGRCFQIALTLISAITMQAANAGQSLHYLPMNQGYGDGGLWLDFSDNDQRDWFTRFTEPDRVPTRSTLSLRQDFSDYSLYWGVADSAEQNAQTLGFQYNRLRLTGFRGDGDTVSTVIHPFNSVGSYQFHGGLKQHYQFSGARIGYDVSANNSMHFSHARIQAPGFNDRTAYELGLAGKILSLSVTRVEEASQYAGRAISASAGFGRHMATFQHLKADNDASYSSLRFDTTTRTGSSFELAIEQRLNPLFDEGNENRITVGYRRSFGANPLMRLDGEESESTDSEQNKSSTAFLAGLGAVGVALALSSGGGDDRNRFSTQNGAAFHVLNKINPTSIAENREYGGSIFRYSDGSYAYSQPIRGSNDSVLLPNPYRVAPEGSSPASIYHTHAAFDPRYDNENFSPADLRNTQLLRLDSYLGTPLGQFKYAQFSTRTIFTLGGPGTLATE